MKCVIFCFAFFCFFKLDWHKFSYFFMITFLHLKSIFLLFPNYIFVNSVKYSCRIFLFPSEHQKEKKIKNRFSNLFSGDNIGIFSKFLLSANSKKDYRKFLLVHLTILKQMMKVTKKKHTTFFILNSFLYNFLIM